MWACEESIKLPRQLCRVLELLERGLSEKEIASSLDLSPHTVRDYCKALHRRFGVHSRGELLAASRRLPRAPVLSSDGV